MKTHTKVKKKPLVFFFLLGQTKEHTGVKNENHIVFGESPKHTKVKKGFI